MHINDIVTGVIGKKEELLKILKDKETPLYLFDEKTTDIACKEFKTLFEQEIKRFHPYYAMKSNPHPYILESVLKHGYGIDVSSGRELSIALEAGATDMIFTGPGKTQKELDMAIKHNEKVIINIDSFGELRRLAELCEKKGIRIRAGVRISMKVYGNWNKFGVPLDDLKQFVEQAQRYPFINLQGIQMHMSWNETVEPYQKAFDELVAYLKHNFTKNELSWITYIDFGGGFLPQGLNGDYDLSISTPQKMQYTVDKGLSIKEYAQGISKVINNTMNELVDCVYYAEPGRIIATPSMLVALRVIDVKKQGVAIIDGGNNMIGWERYESEYHPVINVTHPSEKEIPCLLYGSLCTPHDIWGYTCFAEKIEEGDVLILPNQGAYTYTLAQNFIKDIPEVTRI